MKICFLGDAGSIHIKRWCEFFKECGDDVYLISFRDASIEGVKVINIGEGIKVKSEGGNLQYLKRILKIKNILSNIKPDLVNAHYLTSYGLLAALSKKTPLVVSTWGSDILVAPNKNIIYKLITEYVINKSELLTSDSNFMSKEIVRLGSKEEAVITAPMGIEPSIFNNEDRQRSKGIKSFLSMRTLCDNSNIDIIIKAFYRLLKENDDISLTIVNDGDKRAELEHLIKDLNLEDNVDIRGAVSREEVVKLLKEKDVYISVPTSDSTSVTLLESMACGIFPIVSNLPANKEWIKDGVNGYILDNINEEDLLKAMKMSLENNDLIQEAIDINSQIIKERAIWEDNMNTVRNAYMSLIK